jgi:serine/threonine-protein kinase
MGEVFRATDEQLGRPVAVKLLLAPDRDPRAAERFHREARAAARLNDPHVVSVYDFGHHGDGFFLVMELVEGRTVADELAEHGPMPKERAIDIVEQAAAGLAAAHREDVVHRDVKPGNLLLTPDGTVKVADFGIAHLPGEGTTTLTAAGEIIGSTLYLAPERAAGGQAGKAADVYSLGCVLYQLVTGVPPFTAEHPTAILYQHVDAEPAPPSLIRPELGGPFEAVLLQMLAKDPAYRPSAAEVAAGSLRAERISPATTPLVPVHQGRRTTLLAGGIALLAAAVAVITAILLNGNETRVPPTTDVGPQPSVTSSTTPAATGTSTRPTQAGTTSRPTSAQPSQSTTQPTASPTPSATPTPTSTTPSTKPTRSTPTPTVPTQSTPSTGTSPSSTPPSATPTTSTPASSTPSPAAQVTGTPASD